MTNNKLKIIAIISMILDHIGFYFCNQLNPYLYVLFRSLGRLAMPIFTFLVVEGYLKTKNLKKYLVRLSILAFITQGVFIIFDNLSGDNSLYLMYTLNIIFSYILLVFLFCIFEYILKFNTFKSKILFTIYILFLVLIYYFIKIDYGIILIILGFLIYLLRKYLSDKKIIYMLGMFICFVCLSIIMFIEEYNVIVFGMNFSLLLILTYNGKLGKKNKYIKYLFYSIFPLQHLLLYGIYILI